MPTTIISGEKTAFINIVSTQNQVEAIWLTTNLVNYEDIPNAINRQTDFFTYPNYLNTALAVFTDASLVAVGIFNNKTLNNQNNTTSISGNQLVFNNTSVSGTLNWNTTNTNLLIAGTSNINLITITSTCSNLIIGPLSLVSVIDSTNISGLIIILHILDARNEGGILTQLVIGSKITNFLVDVGATFGGYGISDSIGTCNIPATGLAASNVGNTFMTISWTNPSGWLFNYLSYKITNTNTWIAASISIGNFLGDTGFLFNQLQPNTSYDFQVIEKCINGVLATPALLTQMTTSS